MLISLVFMSIHTRNCLSLQYLEDMSANEFVIVGSSVEHSGEKKLLV